MSPHAARTVTARSTTLVIRRRGFTATLVAPFRTVAVRVVQELRMRRDLRLLSEMGDIELADMGLIRSQIADAVRSGRVSPWLDRA
jgi:uncharacterized protein YjiS (DUF1127 family)